jgi:UDP-GlcNAc:undecaprenyl-phosphate GlcNAc-1-phosphate transferase
MGLIDDVRQLKPWPRFVAQNIVATFSASILVVTNTLGSPSGLLVIDFAVTVFWLVGVTNSINFFDNIDGGASGTIAISSLTLTFIALSSGQVLIAAMAIVLAGSTIGFLLWNKPPARIYMGDAGALFLGLLIATLTIRLDSRQELGRFGLFIPIFLLAVPILDTSVAVIKRIARGISPFQGGRDHLSHRLMRLGLSKRTAVMTLWFASAVFSFLALMLSRNLYNWAESIVFFGVILWTLLFTFFLSTRDNS